MEVLYLFLSVISSILCVILFFKVWGMCNDVDKLTKFVISKWSEKGTKSPNESEEYKVGDLVVWKETGKQMRIASIRDEGTYECRTNQGETFVGNFSSDELVKFKE